MKIDEIAPLALSLPLRDRARLAASLWESLEDPYELAADLTDDNAIRLAETRDRELEEGLAGALSHEELMRRLRK